MFQKYIIQHPFFDRFMPDSVSTIRLTTAIDKSGNCTVRAGHLKFGRNSDTHIKTTSFIKVPIHLPDGSLYDTGHLPDWSETGRHPDTKTTFAGKRIPGYSKCVSTVIELHKQMPLPQCIGWDLTVDCNDKVKVMEWNANINEIKFSEAIQGPCFSDLEWEKLWRRREK